MPKGGNISPKTQFKKGQSGNPNGRPKGALSRKTIIKKWLEVEENFVNPINGATERMNQYDIAVLAMLKKTREGDVMAFRELMDGVFGKITNNVDVTTEGEKINQPPVINVKWIKPENTK